MSRPPKIVIGLVVAFVVAIVIGLFVLVVRQAEEQDGPASAESTGVLTRVIAPPNQPPEIAVTASDLDDPLQFGTVYNGRWRTGSQTVDLSSTSDIVAWPPAVDGFGLEELSVRLPSEAVPAFLTVQVYGSDLGPGGEPMGEPTFIVDCASADLLATGSPCSLLQRDGYLYLTGVRINSGVSRLAVNIHWQDVAESDVSGETVWATWLFSVEHQ